LKPEGQMIPMDALTLYLTIFFALCLAGGAYAAMIYNRFSRKQVQIQEALDNIDLFLDQRQATLESLLPLLDQLSDRSRQTVVAAVEQLRQSPAPLPADMPGRASRIARADQTSRQVKQQLQADHLPATARVLDSIDRSETELNGARRFHNALVREHNTLVKQFPAALVALLLRIRPLEFLNEQPA
jgi:LemA protein